MFAWHYLALYQMAINKARLIMVKGDQLLDATIVASLAILLSSIGVTHTHRMPGHEVRVVATKAMAIRDIVIVMVMVMGRPMVEPMPWIPMSSRGIQLFSLKGINQDYLVIMSIGLMRLSQKVSSGTAPCKA